MTADEDALLNTIAANPADDLPRLVYADWLEEHGRGVRAEFIRLQVEIAKLEVGPRDVIDQNVPLWKRQQELLDGHMAELLGALAGLAHGAERPPKFGRGFVSEVWVNDGWFFEHAAALADMRVPPAVCVKAPEGHANDWAAAPGRHLITELDLSESVFFDIHARFDTAEWWRGFTRLRSLDMSNNLHNVPSYEDRSQGDVEVQRIPWAELPALVDLDISNNNITDAGVIALINTGLPQRLERLILGGNPIGDPSAYELADRVGRSRTLKHLNLRYTDMTNAGQQAILSKFGGRVDLF